MGNDLDSRSDIYALAAVLFEMVTGDLPFDATTPVSMMEAHCNHSIVPAPIKEKTPNFPFSDQLYFVIRRAMETEPEDRYQNVDEFRVAFNAWFSMVRSGEDSGFFDQPDYQIYSDGAVPQRKAPVKKEKPAKKKESISSAQVVEKQLEVLETADKKLSKSKSTEASSDFSPDKLQSLVEKTRQDEIEKKTKEANEDKNICF